MHPADDAAGSGGRHKQPQIRLRGPIGPAAGMIHWVRAAIYFPLRVALGPQTVVNQKQAQNMGGPHKSGQNCLL